MRTVSRVIVFLVSVVLGCQSGSQPEPEQYSVPSEVEPYIQAFRTEAQSRNVSVLTSNLIVTFGASLGEDVCGQCIVEAGKTPRIILNSDEYCWKTTSDNERACLVFHELGHCLLKRTHKTDRFPNGAYVSLMNPDDVAVFATCRYPIGGDDCDKRPRRTYYLDELFDPTTPAPAWGK
ncbi:putative metallopeptidase [Spirosoma sp. KNUC1025]|uniref:putative metallopeptidase n=1 Tax=Spirosoma sp. KNUC1025 TaxID=2894082 RepID=UPI0038649425|nr:hypothetical protein LN737_11190 [Spirosoma sp. KNUC1025]